MSVCHINLSFVEIACKNYGYQQIVIHAKMLKSGPWADVLCPCFLCATDNYYVIAQDKYKATLNLIKKILANTLFSTVGDHRVSLKQLQYGLCSDVWHSGARC